MGARKPVVGIVGITLGAMGLSLLLTTAPARAELAEKDKRFLKTMQQRLD